jgi:hypothetical protein
MRPNVLHGKAVAHSYCRNGECPWSGDLPYTQPEIKVSQVFALAQSLQTTFDVASIILVLWTRAKKDQPFIKSQTLQLLSSLYSIPKETLFQQLGGAE